MMKHNTKANDTLLRKLRRTGWMATALLASLLSLLSCSEKDMDMFLLPGEGEYPTVVGSYPVDGALGIDSGENIWVMFNMEMDQQKTQSSFRLSSAGGSVSGDFTWEGNKMVFTPREPLSGADQYTMVVGRTSESSSGVDLGSDYIVRFYAVSDITRPRFVSSTPTNNESGVAVDTNITLRFSKPIDYSSIADGLSVSPSFIYTVSQSADLTEVIIHPSSALTQGTYTVRVNKNLLDTGGNELYEEATIAFVVGTEFTAPAVLGVSSGGIAFTEGLITSGIERTSPIVIQFSETMDRSSAESAVNIIPSAGWTRSWNGTGDTLTLTFNPYLEPETYYTFNVDSTARDVAGNGLDTNYTYQFYTNGLNSLRPLVEGVFQERAASILPIGCAGVTATGTYTTSFALADFNLLDVAQIIDATGTCVFHVEIRFNNPMVRSSLLSNMTFSQIIDPTAHTFQIYDIVLNSNVATLKITSDVVAPSDATVTPIYKLTVRGGSTGVYDSNGNTMADDYVLYLSY